MKQDRKCSICGYVVHGDEKDPEKEKKWHEKCHDKKVMWVAVW